MGMGISYQSKDPSHAAGLNILVRAGTLVLIQCRHGSQKPGKSNGHTRCRTDSRISVVKYEGKCQKAQRRTRARMDLLYVTRNLWLCSSGRL